MGDGNWKIADFGLTTEGSWELSRTTHAARGTDGYRAPEMLYSDGGRQIFTQKSDIWSLGCIFFEIMTSGKAFPSDHAIIQYAQFPDERKPRIPFGHYTMSHVLQQSVTKLLDSMLSLNPQERPPSAELHKTFSVSPLELEPSGRSGVITLSPKPSHIGLVIIVSAAIVVFMSGLAVRDNYKNWVNLITHFFAAIAAFRFLRSYYHRGRDKEALFWYRWALSARLFQVTTIIAYWVTGVMDQQPHLRCWRMDGVVTMCNNAFQMSY